MSGTAALTRRACGIGLLLTLLGAPLLRAGGGCLEIRNGYFWDPTAGDYFIPRGVAYQIWNPLVGANQSLDQVDYDLLEFKKLHANSVRVEMTWGQVEIAPDQYDWTKPDHLVTKAEELGLKLFVIIGYQYPPAWFSANGRGINNLGLRSDVMQCLSNSTPSNALSCLPPRTAQDLQATNSPAMLAQVLDCLVTGAQAGGVSNVLVCLQAALTPEQLAANLPHLVSDVINYEDPQARAVYQKYIATVTARYKDSPAIGAWILGNEYAYFDLWEDPDLYPVHRFLGYDPISQQSFRDYLQSIYHTNIAALNANWLTSYADFDSVVMPLEYPADRRLPGYQDLIQWRKQSVGNYVALGAVATQQADPNHLRTYSMVGGLFNGRDANFTCEDAKAIVGCCVTARAPLDFWSINNYAWASLGSEMRSASFGIGKYQAQSGLPVMISETGHSSTENLFDYDKSTDYSYAGARQPKALPSTMWESLLSGAIGVHFFNWNDRSIFTKDYFYRERGFGIVQETRQPKQPVYDNMAAMFRQMDNIHIAHLLGGSSNPPPDVQYLWSTNADMVWPRANQENAMIWGALRRLGFQPGIIDDEQFERGAGTNAPALLLSRCYQMSPAHLQRLATEVLAAGIHIHAEADLPGQFDAYDRANTNWAGLMQTLFGINVSGASLGLDLIVTNDCYSPIHLRGASTLGPITPSYAVDLTTWKLWTNVAPVSARTVLTAFGFPLSGSESNCPYVDMTPYPALLVNTPGAGLGKTAVNPFAVGDTYNWSGTAASRWDTRYAILHAIYQDHFGLRPVVELSGPGSEHVISTYRICANGSSLIALLNEDTNTASLTISAPKLLAGRKVEDLSHGGVLARNSSGTLTYSSLGDDCVILYAYQSDGRQDDSLVNPNPSKVWFQAAPLAVWPTGFPTSVGVGYDTTDTNLALTVTLEQTSPRQTVYAQSSSTNIAGHGSLVVQVPVPDADANNPDYISSHEGGQYVFHAALLQAGVAISDVSLPVRLLFGVHPTQPFPSALIPGQTYPVSLAWEELASYASGNYTPLDRAALWDSLAAGWEHYRVVLKLKSAGQVLASDSFLTSEGTGSNTVSIPVPPGAVGPFTWDAYLQTATNILSHNVEESFEGYTRGAKWNPPPLPFVTNNLLAPWISYPYAWPLTNVWLNEGVQLEGSDGSQSAFIVASMPSWVVVAGFGMYYEFTNGDWALPADPRQWTNYVFSYDFKESHGYPCSVEMQVKNVDPLNSGKWIQYTNLYSPGADLWFTTRASLDQFLPPPDLSGVFEPDKVHAIVLNIRMLTPDVQYVGSFDNIRFLGPEVDQGGGEITSIYTSANDALGWLGIQSDASGVKISWIGGGVLQSAASVNGPWTDLGDAGNPFLVHPPPSSQFYRLRQATP